MPVPILFRRRSITRLLLFCAIGFALRAILSQSSHTNEIRKYNVLERVTRSEKTLDVQRHQFLQARLGRDERDDLFSGVIRNGLLDYWERFQKPFITGYDTSHMDTQVVRSSVEGLLALNGWVAALCPTLIRPFGQNKRDDHYYAEMARQNHLYYIAIVIHSADHFLVDQLAVIVQLSKRLGTQNIFVSMLDYDSTDATPTLLDLCEAVLTLLGIPFRIRRVTGMTEDPSAAYYPLEEEYARNLALQPLRELYDRRATKFHRVIWLKGFTCPNDILELIKVSEVNEAAMVCGMDWAEHNGFFIFSDRWRTRDMHGDQFRQSKSSSRPDAGPPRDREGSTRYSLHLPFQVFCCESGTHVVDPAQSYYRGIVYRSARHFHNLSTADLTPEWDPDAPCMDSSQAWFCRDLWIDAARDGMREKGADRGQGNSWLEPDAEEPDAFEAQHQAELGTKARRNNDKEGGTDANMKVKIKREDVDPDIKPEVKQEGADAHIQPKGKQDGADADIKPKVRQEGADADIKPKANQEGGDVDIKPKIKVQVAADADKADAAPVRRPAGAGKDADANAGSDYDAMPDSDIDLPDAPPPSRLSIPNSAFRPARILVNPRCVTTYAGVSHTKLARDLFGEEDSDGTHSSRVGGKYVLDDWESAPDSFVCQEQRQTGGRQATKTQRRLGFTIHDEIRRLP